MDRSFLSRAARARALAKIRPEAREALRFYAEVSDLQHSIDPDSPFAHLRRLLSLVEARGPGPLRDAARELDEEACRSTLEDPSSPRSFFARVLFQTARDRPQGLRGCPRCRHLPQVGCLRPQGDGTAFFLVCSLCFHEWVAPRDLCGECGKDVSFHEAREIPHLRVRTCDGCRRYIHVVRLDVDPEAIPEVDEIAALSLDVWAREQGYEKVFPNLAGI